MVTETKLGASENDVKVLESWLAFGFLREVCCFELRMVVESKRVEIWNDLLLLSICCEPM
jgi:hypothetical protein